VSAGEQQRQQSAEQPLEPFELAAHVAVLRTELASTRRIMALAGAAALLAALACLYAARTGAS
jgi:hypothetical protein